MKTTMKTTSTKRPNTKRPARPEDLDDATARLIVQGCYDRNLAKTFSILADLNEGEDHKRFVGFVNNLVELRLATRIAAVVGMPLPKKSTIDRLLEDIQNEHYESLAEFDAKRRAKEAR